MSSYVLSQYGPLPNFGRVAESGLNAEEIITVHHGNHCNRRRRNGGIRVYRGNINEGSGAL